MTALLLAHVSHWSHLVLYLVPVVAVLVAIVLSSLRERRLREDGGEPEDGPPSERNR